MRNIFSTLISVALMCGVSHSVAANELDNLVVEPMLTSDWNQGEPYNITFREKINWDVTGCVMTAMAQVMYYHKFPEVPIRDSQYTFNNQIIDLPLTSMPFQWDKMRDTYWDYDNYTEEEARAVSDLMFAISTTIAGHAVLPYAQKLGQDYEVVALKYFFGYHENACLLSRDYFDDTTWANIVKYELSCGRPVFFSGSSHEIGHAFVCDGYKDGLFHFNMGGGGVWYDLNTMIDRSDEYSASNAQFLFNQRIAVCVAPGNVSEAPTNPYIDRDYSFLCIGNFGESFEVHRCGIDDFKGAIGVKAENILNGNTEYISVAQVNYTDNTPKKVSFDKSVLGTLPNGQYRITPARRSQNDADWIDIPVRKDRIRYLTADVKNGSVDLSYPERPEFYADITVKNITPEYTAFEGNSQYITLEVSNKGNADFLEEIYAKVERLDKAADYPNLFFVVAAEHGQENLTMSYWDKYIDLPGGSYLVQFQLADGTVVSEKLPLEIYSLNETFWPAGIDYVKIRGRNEAVVLRNQRGRLNGRIEIPSQVEFNGEQLTVVEVEDNAFVNYPDIKELILPPTLRKLGAYICGQETKMVLLGDDLEVKNPSDYSLTPIFVFDDAYDKISSRFNGNISVHTLATEMDAEFIDGTFDMTAPLHVKLNGKAPYMHFRLYSEDESIMTFDLYNDYYGEYSSITLNPVSPGYTRLKVMSDQPYIKLEKWFEFRTFGYSSVDDINESAIRIHVEGTTIKTSSPDAELEVYDMAGRNVSPENLAPGIYVARTSDATTKIVIR